MNQGQEFRTELESGFKERPRTMTMRQRSMQMLTMWAQHDSARVSDTLLLTVRACASPDDIPVWRPVDTLVRFNGKPDRILILVLNLTRTRLTARQGMRGLRVWLSPDKLPSWCRGRWSARLEIPSRMPRQTALLTLRGSTTSRPTVLPRWRHCPWRSQRRMGSATTTGTCR